MKTPFTRRHFLNLVGAAGGATAVYQTSRAMGLLEDTGPVAQLDLKEVGRGNKSVAILGAGIAGLSIAYELERAGYDVTIIEASHRIGGRNLTIRHGDVIDEMGNRQVCQFDDDPNLFFNAGPARVPGHHRRVMHYCKALDVPLIVKANSGRQAYTHQEDLFDGKPVRVGRYMADGRGFLSELLYKAADKNAFDQPLSGEDRERLMRLARTYGDLREDGRYTGSLRAGYKSGGFATDAEQFDPLDFRAMLDSQFWQFSGFYLESPDYAEPLLEAVGGMDNIVKGFVRNIRSPILLNAQVQSIELQQDGVDVVYNHKGERRKFSADYCFNSIPAYFMRGIPNNLPDNYMEALNSMRQGWGVKVGLQMRERFWEREGIYGGMTTTSQRIGQIWYPSHDIHREKGVVLGAYEFYDPTGFFDRMTPAERVEYAGKCGDRIHEGYSSYIESGVSVCWRRMNHMMGCGAGWGWGAEDQRDKYYPVLQQPAGGRHYMVGDQISHHSSWQEGAFASAEFALLDLDRRVRAEFGESRKA
jgi:monoamine oxidase